MALIKIKMKSYSHIYALFLVFVFYTSCKGQVKSDLAKDFVNNRTQDTVASHGPNGITRNIIQDKKGNIWIAAFDGIFRFDGKSFENITSKVSSARFFSVLEDRKGNLWFGSIGSGVYYFDARLDEGIRQGQSLKNFTTSDGLLNNEITCIYEDKAGNIWFGAGGGASLYDGKSFRNFIIDGDAMNEDSTGKTFLTRPPYEVTSIIEDKTGRLWFATRGNTFVYDPRRPDGQGKTFTVFTHEGKPFKNVRSLTKDKNGNIWLGGNDGLWRYNGSTSTNFTQKFVGHIIEDKKGNIWTSSERSSIQAWPLYTYNGKSLTDDAWALSRYDEMTLSGKKPTATEIAHKPMFFGILEANDGNIWFGSVNGVYRYNGKIVTYFKSVPVQQ